MNKYQFFYFLYFFRSDIFYWRSLQLYINNNNNNIAGLKNSRRYFFQSNNIHRCPGSTVMKQHGLIINVVTRTNSIIFAPRKNLVKNQQRRLYGRVFTLSTERRGRSWNSTEKIINPVFLSIVLYNCIRLLVYRRDHYKIIGGVAKRFWI